MRVVKEDDRFLPRPPGRRGAGVVAAAGKEPDQGEERRRGPPPGGVDSDASGHHSTRKVTVTSVLWDCGTSDEGGPGSPEGAATRSNRKTRSRSAASPSSGRRTATRISVSRAKPPGRQPWFFQGPIASMAASGEAESTRVASPSFGSPARNSVTWKV